MKSVSVKLATVAAVALLAAVMQARANSVQVTATYMGDNPTDQAYITSSALPPAYNGALFWVGRSNFTNATVTETDVGGGSTQLTAAEVISAMRGSGGTIPNGQLAFTGYCIDLAQFISADGSSSTWNVYYLKDVKDNNHGITAEQASAIQNLWDSHAVLHPTNDQAATFQMALWTIIYNQDPTNSIGVTFGNNGSQVSKDEIANATTWATAAWNDRNLPSTSTSPVYALVSATKQDFSIALYGAVMPAGQLAVPLPAAAGVGFGMLGGFGMLAGLRKRLRRRARIA